MLGIKKKTAADDRILNMIGRRQATAERQASDTVLHNVLRHSPLPQMLRQPERRSSVTRQQFMQSRPSLLRRLNDSDGDGVPNWLDCMPFNRKKQADLFNPNKKDRTIRGHAWEINRWKKYVDEKGEKHTMATVPHVEKMRKAPFIFTYSGMNEPTYEILRKKGVEPLTVDAVKDYLRMRGVSEEKIKQIEPRIKDNLNMYSKRTVHNLEDKNEGWMGKEKPMVHTTTNKGIAINYANAPPYSIKESLYATHVDIPDEDWKGVVAKFKLYHPARHHMATDLYAGEKGDIELVGKLSPEELRERENQRAMRLRGSRMDKLDKEMVTEEMDKRAEAYRKLFSRARGGRKIGSKPLLMESTYDKKLWINPFLPKAQFYHGTATADVPKIMKEGLLSSAEINKVNYPDVSGKSPIVWSTQRPALAHRFSKERDANIPKGEKMFNVPSTVLSFVVDKPGARGKTMPHVIKGTFGGNQMFGRSIPPEKIKIVPQKEVIKNRFRSERQFFNIDEKDMIDKATKEFAAGPMAVSKNTRIVSFPDKTTQANIKL